MVILDRVLISAVLLLLCAMPPVAYAAKSTGTLRSPIRLALIEDEQIAVTEFAQQKVLILDARTHSLKGEPCRCKNLATN